MNNITRFSVLPDDRKVLMGVDKAGLFKTGVVYEAIEIMDEILLRPVGKYALPKTGYPSELSENQDIMYSGLHIITEKELNEINKDLKNSEDEE